MAKKITTTKVRKKLWVQIVAPKMFNEQVLGELPLYEPSSAIGRHITINLMTLTGDMRKQSTNIEFLMNELKGSRIHTKAIGIQISPNTVKRFMRRSKSKLDDSFVVQSKDNVYVTLKPVFITASATHRSVLAALRAKARDIIALECKKRDYDKIFVDLMTSNLQKTVKDALRKIFPLKICEIRYMKIVNEQKIKYIKVVVAKPVKEKPKEEPKPAEEKQKTAEVQPIAEVKNL